MQKKILLRPYTLGLDQPSAFFQLFKGGKITRSDLIDSKKMKRFQLKKMWLQNKNLRSDYMYHVKMKVN